MEQVIRLTTVNHLIRKWWRGIAIWLIMGLAVASWITWGAMTPKYAATVQILVNQRTGNETTLYNNQQANVDMIPTYKQLLMNTVVLQPAQQNLEHTNGIQRSISTLKREIKVTSAENSQVLSVTVNDRSALDSQAIANAVSQSFQQRVPKIIRIDNASIVSPAQASLVPVSPNPFANLGIGILVGILIGFAYAIIRESADRKVHDAAYLQDNLGLNVLGVVNHQSASRRN